MTWQVHKRMQAKPAPELAWSSTAGLRFEREDLEGKIIVVNFWATWCGPCIVGIPKYNKLHDELEAKGVAMVAVCVDGPKADFERIVAQNKVRYRSAYDGTGRTNEAWNVVWFPSYAIIDIDGRVIAMGLNYDVIAPTIDRMLAREQPSEEQEMVEDHPGGIDPSWLEGDADRQTELMGLVESKAGQSAPPLPTDGWIVGDPVTLTDRLGQVVLLQFMASWSGPSMARLATLQAAQEKHVHQGLAVVGVAHDQGAEAFVQAMQQHGANFPIVRDPGQTLAKTYGINGYPDGVLIGRDGSIKALDFRDDCLDKALDALLSEPAPSTDTTP